jgi:hypothetical protein
MPSEPVACLLAFWVAEAAAALPSQSAGVHGGCPRGRRGHSGRRAAPSRRSQRKPGAAAALQPRPRELPAKPPGGRARSRGHEEPPHPPLHGQPRPRRGRNGRRRGAAYPQGRFSLLLPLHTPLTDIGDGAVIGSRDKIEMGIGNSDKQFHTKLFVPRPDQASAVGST